MKKEKTKDTRTAILETALNLVWSQSYGSVSVDDICKCANVRKGSFYHYFASKAELACAVLDHLWEELRPELDRIFSPQNTPLQRLKLYTEATLEQQASLKKSLGHVVGCPFTTIACEQCSCDDGIRAKACEILKRVELYLVSTIRDAVSEKSIPEADANSMAIKLLTYELGALAFSRARGDLTPLEDLYEVWRRILQAPAV